MNAPLRVPADRALPRLAAALDPECMRAEFSRSLGKALDKQAGCARPGTGDAPSMTVQACTVRRVKYKPGRNCLLWYELDITRCDGRVSSQWYAARMYAPNQSTSRFQKARCQVSTMPTFGPAVMHLDGMDMVAWSFPNERKLDGLRLLTDPALLRSQVLPGVACAGFGDDWLIESVRPCVVSYAPEYTCNLRVDLTLAHRTKATRRDWRVYGKTYYDDRGADTFKLMRELYASSARGSASLALPRPLAYEAQSRSLWQSCVPGITLHRASRESSAPSALGRAARAVATLHGIKLVPGRQVGVNAVVDRLPVLPCLLADLGIHSARAAHDLARKLADDARALPELTPVLLHGDLHAKNILLPGISQAGDENGAAALIDLDTLASGPPAHDIGSWLAALLCRGLVDGERPEHTLALAGEFVCAYRASAPVPVSTAQLRWFTAAALLNERAFRTLTRLKPGRLGYLPDIVALAADVATGKSGAFT